MDSNKKTDLVEYYKKDIIERNVVKRLKNNNQNIPEDTGQDQNSQTDSNDQSVQEPIISALNEAKKVWDRLQGGSENSINDSGADETDQKPFADLPEKYRNDPNQFRDLLIKMREHPEDVQNLPDDLSELQNQFINDGNGFRQLLELFDNQLPSYPPEPVLPPENGFLKNLKTGAAWTGIGNDLAKTASSGYKLGATIHAHPSVKGKSFWDKDSWKLPDNKFTQQIDPWSGGMTNSVGAALSAADTVKGIINSREKYKNIDEGGDPAELIESLLDTGSSAAKTASGTMEAIRNFKNIGKTAANAASASKAIPILGIVTGLFSGVRGFMQSHRNKKAENTIDNLPATSNRKLEMILNQGKRAAHINKWAGRWKGISGILSALSGGFTLGGAMPVSLALGATSGAINAFTGVYERVKKFNLRKDVVAEEYDIDWDYEIPLFREWVKTIYPNMGLRNKEVREIILKAHGSKARTRTDAFKAICQRRAKYLIDLANSDNENGDIAGMVIQGFGITPVNMDNDGNSSFSAGAAKILAEKLG